jgi:hypothetical protein
VRIIDLPQTIWCVKDEMWECDWVATSRRYGVNSSGYEVANWSSRQFQFGGRSTESVDGQARYLSLREQQACGIQPRSPVEVKLVV